MIKLEIDSSLSQGEYILKAGKDDPIVTDLVSLLETKLKRQVNQPSIKFYQAKRQCVVELARVLFFETEAGKVYAHTKDKVYRVDAKLYQLDEWLGTDFLRISKSGIVNVNQIVSFSKSVLGNQIEFAQTEKVLYVSRRYVKKLVERLNEVIK